MSHLKAAFTTLGCKVNQNETEALIGIFRRHGYEIVDFKDYADVYVINTCTVTHLGDRKSRQIIRRATKTNPDAVVVVMGCYAQVSPDEVKQIPGVDVVIGTRERDRIIELIEQARRDGKQVNAVTNIMSAVDFEELPLYDLTTHTRAFVKIQEGCDQFCTYCIIPYARGPLRSRPPDRVIEEVTRLVAHGYREVVLTGIHTASYGRDLGGKEDLADLLADVAGVPGLRRIRLSSLEPIDVSPSLAEVIKTHPVICRHLHIPLQSGDDHILNRMGRPYSTREFADLVTGLRQELPGLAVTTDLMVGFPGETEENFHNTVRFVKEMEFSGIHVFKYSPRAGTRAAAFPDQVNPLVKDRRSKAVLSLSKELFRQFAVKFTGQTMEVLAEQLSNDMPGHWEGYTDNYLRVVFPAAENLRGQFIMTKLKEVKTDFILGEIFSD